MRKVIDTMISNSQNGLMQGNHILDIILAANVAMDSHLRNELFKASQIVKQLTVI